jgi:dihydroorotase
MQVIRDHDGTITSITLRRISNFHAHLRRDAMMRAISRHIMRHVLYLLVMPNAGPIRTMEEAIAHHDELMEYAKREGFDRLKLLMTLYHTRDITPAVIEQIAKSSVVYAVKHYPSEPGLTTGSGGGAPLEESDEMLCAMEDTGVPLLGHFELGYDKYNVKLDPLLGEATMVKEKLWRLRDRHPRLKICFEHISTIEGIEWVKADTSGNTVATITPHHPLLNHNDIKTVGEDALCKPILQTPENQFGTAEFMVSGDPRAISGNDSAGHPSKMKYVTGARPAYGCFLTEQSVPFYASVFIKHGAMDQRFENFMSLNGPRWWGLPPPDDNDTITIVKSDDDMPEPVQVPEMDDVVVPLGWKPNPVERIHVGYAVQE